MAEHRANIQTDICVRMRYIIFCKSQYRLNNINTTLQLLTCTVTHARFYYCRLKISISMREERKEETSIQDRLHTVEEIFSLRCRFYNVIVKQVSSCEHYTFLIK